MPFEAVPLSGSLGAEIRGVDVASLDDAGFAAVHAALLDHGVIYFRDQELDPDAYLAFAKRWGEVHLHPYLKGLDDRPEIIEIVREADDPTGFADHWHTDQSFTQRPAMATMLYAKEVPAAGGDTLFANLHAPYDALSDGMKALAAGLRTHNLYNKQAPRSAKMAQRVTDKDKPAEPAFHPLVRVHPETGRPALYLNDSRSTRRFEGMTEEESLPLLDWLMSHATRPEFTCRLRWEAGHARHLGQPPPDAHGRERLFRPEARHAPHHHQGRAHNRHPRRACASARGVGRTSIVVDDKPSYLPRRPGQRSGAQPCRLNPAERPEAGPRLSASLRPG